MRKKNKNSNNPFISLRNKNFRYYWIGMSISMIGTWMQNIAQPWLAYSLTKSPFLLSVVVTVQFIPMLLFSLFAGVIIERFPKKKILLITQSASLIITLILAILICLNHIQYWNIVVASFAIGCVNTIDMPTRQIFVSELVDKEELMNAIALNMSVFNLAKIIGPVVAAIVMAYGGVAACFYANSFSFSAVIVGLVFIKTPTVNVIFHENRKMLTEIKDGIKYIYNESNLILYLMSGAIVGTFGMNFSILVPVLAKVVLKQQEAGFGVLMSFMGAGSLAGAVFVASRSKSGPKRSMVVLGPILIALCMILTGLTSIYLFTGLSLAAIGICFVIFSTNSSSSMQLEVEEEYRGRLMSINTLAFNGLTPVGATFTGFITEHFGPKEGFIVNGIIIILLSILLQIYLQKHFRSNKKLRVA